MFPRIAKKLILIAAVAAISSCGGGSGSSSSSSGSLSNGGEYCHGEFNKLIIDDSGAAESYSIVIGALGSTPISVSGTRNGNLLTINGASGMYTFNGTYTFLNNAAEVTGQITITAGGSNYVWNEAGTAGDCPSVDVNANGIPQFIDQNFVDVINDIDDISLFRSAAGHDYSDDFESCRSMKHYFSPPVAKRANSTVSVYSPLAGKIVHLETEEANFTDDGVTNQKVIIQSEDYPGVLITFFHIDLLSTNISVNSDVTAGQQIGYANMVRNSSPPSHDFDIAVHINTPAGIQYASFFDTITNTLFATYNTWGGLGKTRSDFIISQTARDADPLTCSGETFTSSGTLPIWYYNTPG